MCRVFYNFIDFDDDISPKEKRRQSSLAAYELLYVAAKLCGYKTNEIEIVKSEKGKPYIKNGAFCFSISHCERFVCVAVSDKEVGIDTQRVGDVNPQVIERFLKKTPSDELANTYLWTDFEAVGKYFGVGIPHEIVLSDDAQITRFECENYCISVCHKTKDICQRPETIINVKE